MADHILEVQNLKKYFKTNRGQLHAVDDVSFALDRGKTLGIVGESGCGKSTTGRCVLRLIEPTEGKVLFDGEDMLSLGKRQMRSRRCDMQIIFQDPFSSLNPRNTVMQTIAEGVRMREKYQTREALEARVLELMETVGLAERLINSYPHELDGGRRQRIGIARALAVEPKLIVCDEPVSALDVSIQAQILNLLKDLQKELNLTYLFIAHDLSVVQFMSDRIMVMYLGKIVEVADSRALYEEPLHPYTKALLSAIPVADIHNRKQRQILEGEVPSPIHKPSGCAFRNRCPHCMDICKEQDPALRYHGKEGHMVACHLYDGEESGDSE